MNTLTSLALFRMKILMTVFSSVVLLTGCDDWFKDPGPEFPDCAGTTNSFDAYVADTYDQYYVTLTGADVIATEFFFTNYFPGTLLSYPNFHLWVKSIVDQNTANYYDGYCTKSYGGGEWIGNSALFYNGEYANCDFEFDIFTCNDISGTCYIYITEPPDTVTYSFEGSK